MALARKVFQINQNISIFLLGIYILRVYNFFGRQYTNGLMFHTDTEEGFFSSGVEQQPTSNNNSSNLESTNKFPQTTDGESNDDTFNSGKFKIEYKSNNKFLFDRKEIDVEGKPSLLKRFQNQTPQKKKSIAINGTDEEDSLKI